MPGGPVVTRAARREAARIPARRRSLSSPERAAPGSSSPTWCRSSPSARPQSLSPPVADPRAARPPDRPHRFGGRSRHSSSDRPPPVVNSGPNRCFPPAARAPTLRHEMPPAIYTYTAAANGLFVNAYLVETGDGVVAIDAGLLVSDARALRARLDALHKPLLAVLVTHGHPDHFNGVVELVSGQRDVPVYATPEGKAVIDEVAEPERAQRSATYGDEWPAQTAYPDAVVDDGATLAIGGLRIRAHELGPCESASEALYIVQGPDDDAPVAFTGDLFLQRPPQLQRRWLHGRVARRARPCPRPARRDRHALPRPRAPGRARGARRPAPLPAHAARSRSATSPTASRRCRTPPRRNLTARMAAFLPDPALEWLVDSQRRRRRRRARRRTAVRQHVKRASLQSEGCARRFATSPTSSRWPRSSTSRGPRSRVNVVQQALSAGVAQLEALVGVQLFERTTRRVRMTAAGEDFLPRAREALAAVDLAIATAPPPRRRRGRPARRSASARPPACPPRPSCCAPSASAIPTSRSTSVTSTFTDPYAGPAHRRDRRRDRAPALRQGARAARAGPTSRATLTLPVRPPAGRPRGGRVRRDRRRAVDEPRDRPRVVRVLDVQPSIAPARRASARSAHRSTSSSRRRRSGGRFGLVPESVARSRAWPGLAFVRVADVEPSVAAIACRPGESRPAVRDFLAVAATS